ncbi:paraquat-inducible protein A [Desulfuromonas versatilis]|uniref:Paraquat-inducible protein A n=2 Tax=Desulfuromonas versatilis TaxID=2802975 RepID=A0ABN6DYQ6_9BACT|nr:paraquat-inducible protein A [Desulfuromonas versatilis]
MPELIACQDCDLLQRVPAIPQGTRAKCSRCGSVLFRHKRNSIERTLAWSLAGLVLYVMANSFPFLAMKRGGLIRETTLTTGVLEFYAQGNWLLATVVTLTCLVFPLIQILGLLYVLGPLFINYRVKYPAQVFRLVHHIEEWGMLEVFMLGILVSVVKLAKMASIIPGLSLYSFGILVFVLAAAGNCLDSHVVWKKLEQTP